MFHVILKYMLGREGLFFRQQKLSFTMSALGVLLQGKHFSGQEGFFVKWGGLDLMSVRSNEKENFV